MKRATVRATFLELKSPDMYPSGVGEGSSAKVAINRAVNDMLSKVKGKRYGSFQCIVFVSEGTAAGAAQ
jgi:hypothetical protein